MELPPPPALVTEAPVILFAVPLPPIPVPVGLPTLPAPPAPPPPPPLVAQLPGEAIFPPGFPSGGLYPPAFPGPPRPGNPLDVGVHDPAPAPPPEPPGCPALPQLLPPLPPAVAESAKGEPQNATELLPAPPTVIV